MIKDRLLNYTIEATKNRQIILFFNHRASLYHWWKAKTRFNGEPIRVLTLDSHYDLNEIVDEDFIYYQAKVDAYQKIKSFMDNQNDNGFKQYVEEKIGFGNENFIVPALKVGIIDEITILSNNMTDVRKKNCDKINCYKPGELKIKNENLLDIDLDFFIDRDNCEKFRRSEKFKLNLDQFNSFTIALEPGCCNGIDKSINYLKFVLNDFLGEIIDNSKEISKCIQFFQDNFSIYWHNYGWN